MMGHVEFRGMTNRLVAAVVVVVVLLSAGSLEAFVVRDAVVQPHQHQQPRSGPPRLGVASSASASEAAAAEESNESSSSSSDQWSTLTPQTKRRLIQAALERAMVQKGRQQEPSISYDDDDDDQEPSPPRRKKISRWDSLNPKVKARIIQEGQQRAIANKKKREPAQAKKRKMLMFWKEQQRLKQRAARVVRPTPFTNRTPLSELKVGQELAGTVISLTTFGAYVDVGTECDGLLHVSQMSREVFVERPHQFVSPGQTLEGLRIRRLSPERKKLHLTLLAPDLVEAEMELQQDDPERLTLEDVMVDDELWGEVHRVTDFGAYVEVGAVVQGFLHFMDHPGFGYAPRGTHPREYMAVGDRVRIWVSDVDTGKNRIKLTANRPPHLPGPRREF